MKEGSSYKSVSYPLIKGMKMRKDAEKIYTGAIKDCLPDNTVRDALSDFRMPKGKLILIAIGKAAWRMARSAREVIEERGGRIDLGAVLTKYGHSEVRSPTLRFTKRRIRYPTKTVFARPREYSS